MFEYICVYGYKLIKFNMYANNIGLLVFVVNHGVASNKWKYDDLAY